MKHEDIEIVRMAREAGWEGPEDNAAYVQMLKRFASLVAVEKAEECAQICDAMTESCMETGENDLYLIPLMLADTIRKVAKR